MRAELRRVHSPDLDLADGKLTDPSSFAILMQVFVGPDQGDGEESFDVIVCTPSWVAAWVDENGPLIGRHHLIVDRFNIGQIHEFLRRRIEQLEAVTWEELASKIGRIGRWEFEDYT